MEDESWRMNDGARIFFWRQPRGGGGLKSSFRPYRIIYRAQQTQTLIYLIVDGRRDMQSLLKLRLLG